MTVSSLIVEGVNIKLGKRIGRGGEGEVFALENDVDRALKIYTSSDIQQREAKITAIVNRKIAQQSSLVAFPLAIARHNDGRFAGFVMKRVQGHKPLFELYSPGARKKHFPKADFRFLIRAAANVSKAVASVHKTGCVIGDINHSGIMISDEAKVALIDADSFQFIDGPQAFLCRVGVPEYTPPELQGKKLGGIVRTANHDAFGLAVVIFQLLFMGRHPFVGAFAKGDMPIERAIFEHRFAYSLKRDVGMTRPPGAASLADFPYEVAEAFEQAFSPEPGAQRPTAEQWAYILENLERSLTFCVKDKLHVYAAAAKECPWCRMEQKLGMLLFLPALLNFSLPIDDQGLTFNLSSIWAAIEKVQVPDPKTLQPTLPMIDCDPSDDAQRVKRKFSQSRLVGGIALTLTLVGLIFMPKLWLLLATIGAYGVKKCLYKVDSETYFVDKYFEARDRFEHAIEKWRTKCGITQITSLRSSLAEAKAQYENLEREKHMRVSLYQTNHAKRHAMQLAKYLESHEIRKAKIRHIGLARQTALASYGIETALDITEEKVLEVAGFGANNSAPLLEWRRNLEQSFTYDANQNELDAEEIQKIQFEIDSKGSELRKKLASGAMDLAQAAHAVTVQFQREDPNIAQAYAQFKREREDLISLGMDVPKRRQIKKFVVKGTGPLWNPSGLFAPVAAPKRAGRAGKKPRFAPGPQSGQLPIQFPSSSSSNGTLAPQSLNGMSPQGASSSAPNTSSSTPIASTSIQNAAPPSSKAPNLRAQSRRQNSPSADNQTNALNQLFPADAAPALEPTALFPKPSRRSKSSGREGKPKRTNMVAAFATSRAERKGLNPTFNHSDTAAMLSCPKCGNAMQARISRKGTKSEKLFYGCSTYPACNGVILP